MACNKWWSNPEICKDQHLFYVRSAWKFQLQILSFLTLSSCVMKRQMTSTDITSLFSYANQRTRSVDVWIVCLCLFLCLLYICYNDSTCWMVHVIESVILHNHADRRIILNNRNQNSKDASKQFIILTLIYFSPILIGTSIKSYFTNIFFM